MKFLASIYAQVPNKVPYVESPQLMSNGDQQINCNVRNDSIFSVIILEMYTIALAHAGLRGLRADSFLLLSLLYIHSDHPWILALDPGLAP